MEYSYKQHVCNFLTKHINKCGINKTIDVLVEGKITLFHDGQKLKHENKEDSTNTTLKE